MSIAKIFDAVMDYDEEEVADLVSAELEKGTDVQLILGDGLVSALDDIGKNHRY